MQPSPCRRSDAGNRLIRALRDFGIAIDRPSSTAPARCTSVTRCAGRRSPEPSSTVPVRRMSGSRGRRTAGAASCTVLTLVGSLLLSVCGGGPAPADEGTQERAREAGPSAASRSAAASAPPAATDATGAATGADATGAADGADAAGAAGGLAQVAGQAPPAAGMLVSIVLLEPHAELDLPLPDETPVMDQIGRQFVPGFILVRAGQTIDFTNSEDDLHTVHVKDERGESIFNVATMMGSTYEHTFEVGGEYSVICNTHTEMFADIMVVDEPYAVVADRDGRFAVPDVVPGRYTATVIQGPDRSRYEIEIAAGPNEIDLTGA